MAWEIVAGRTSEEYERFGLAGTIFLGKHYVKMDKTMSLSNPIYLDVAKPHIILISGKRGSGKSYTLGVLAEGLVNLPPDISENLSCLIFDTMGIFWTMKYPNYRDDKLLKEWGLNPQALRPVIFCPFGLFEKYQSKGVPVDIPFAIKPSDVNVEDWCGMFDLDILSGEGVLIARAIETAKEKYGEFDIGQIIKIIRTDDKASDKEKNVVESLFVAAKGWGLFKKEGTKIEELFKGGTTSILDLSAYSEISNGDRIKALVIGLICKNVLAQRMTARKAEEIKLISEGGFILGPEAVAVAEKRAPLVWILIDEAHEFLPRVGRTLASEPLVRLIREGRQPGISLALATQQPGKIHTDVMTQADLVISHRITAKIDIEALNEISATYLPRTLQFYIDELPPEKGTAILLDDKQEKILCVSDHGSVGMVAKIQQQLKPNLRALVYYKL